MTAPETMFAPPDRATEKTIRAQAEALRQTAGLEQLYNAVNEMIVILNRERQIVFANRNFLLAALIAESGQVEGLRLGEAIGCVHASEAPAGCGTTVFCGTCGAVKAILASQEGRSDVRECRIIKQEKGAALDLLVRTTPIRVEGEDLTITSVRDISHEKRRRVLERVFFHDIMNTAAGVRGLCELMNQADPSEIEHIRDMICTGAARMVEEIKAQRDLAAAENFELQVKVEAIESLALLKELALFFASGDAARGKYIRLSAESQGVAFASDRTLVTRVIGNMIKNALEASGEGETVTMGSRRHDGSIEFWVRNQTCMPRDVQLQIFQRSFSTKGAGRGLGTYGMKLLAERYLGGEIFFTSSEDKGTTFSAVFPLNLEGDALRNDRNGTPRPQ